MAKFVAVLSGLIGFGLLALFFYYLDWKDDAANQKKEISSNIQYYTTVWQKKSGPISIQYDSMDASGFPFDHEIKLFQPRIQFTTPDDVIQISSLLVTFLPEKVARGEGFFWRYKVVFPLEVVVGVKPRGEPQRNFTVHFSEIPEVYFHAQSEVRANNFDEFAVKMPKELMLTVNRGQTNRNITFTFPQMETLSWRYIPNDIHDESVNFLRMLELSLSTQP